MARPCRWAGSGRYPMPIPHARTAARARSPEGPNREAVTPSCRPAPLTPRRCEAVSFREGVCIRGCAAPGGPVASAASAAGRSPRSCCSGLTAWSSRQPARGRSASPPGRGGPRASTRSRFISCDRPAGARDRRRNVALRQRVQHRGEQEARSRRSQGQAVWSGRICSSTPPRRSFSVSRS